MERVSYTPSIWRGATLACVAWLLVGGLDGCVSRKYQLAKKGTPPIEVLNVAFPPAPPLEPVLSALITYGGPGSWKRRALWDEYVVGFKNSSDVPTVLDSVAIIDSTGTAIAPGTDPWRLEKASVALETQYRNRGESFVRGAGTGVLIVGVAGAGAAAAGLSSLYIAPAAAGAMLAGIFVLPVYYVTVIGINHHNKKVVTAEFNRRRLAFPLTLQPGETRVGSLFFPTIRAPRALEVHVSGASGSSATSLPLDFLKGLHVPTPVTSPAAGAHPTS